MEKILATPFFLVGYSHLPTLNKDIFVFDILFLEIAVLVQIF